ncbi:MAG TPA: hypothetical protein VNY78_04640 [Edaphobacter sp.]|jgi:uncharacterized membrane protein|nr:hypothetical protein [Edaphobacter sp.]
MSDLPQARTPSSPPTPAASSGISDNLAAALAYMTVFPAIVFLIIKPYNRMPLVRFHSIQSIGLFIMFILLDAVLRIGHDILHLNWILLDRLDMVAELILFIAWLITIFKALKGEWFKLPIIGDIAERQARA